MDVKIRNTSDRQLGLPNGQIIRPGEDPVLVRNFNKFEDHPVVQAWINAKALVISDEIPAGDDDKGDDKGDGLNADDKGGNDAPVNDPSDKADDASDTADEPVATSKPAANPFAKKK